MVILSDTLSVARQRQAASCSYYYLLSMNQMSAMLLLANMYSGFPAGSVVKNFFYSAGDVGSIPRLGRSPGEGNGNPL